MSRAQDILERARHYVSLINPDLLRGYATLPRANAGANVDSLHAAIEWICRAQDAFPDGGVARSYALAYQPFFKLNGWIASYPETTGYVIPTLFDYAKQTSSAEFLRPCGSDG